MIEAGSKVNWTRSKPAWWTAFSSTTAPRFWAAWKRCRWPAASGGAAARRHRIHNITIHPIPPDEFAVEGYLDVHRDY
jgi:hypothetical protein